jgi:hypothetical protein
VKYLLTVFIGLFYLQTALSQGTYWQQQVNFTIQVTLNDTAKTLDGFEKITYTNNSPDTLHFIWFHIWPNAYRNDKTAYTEQALANGSTDFYFSNDEEKGYINQLDFRVNNIAAGIEAHPQHIDIVKLILPSPIAPKQTITITTPFFVKLPYNFSRGGYTKDGFQVTQWFPKPAVYDANGWHEMPYLDQGEFYSEFGNYEVQITLPDNYIVAATGKLDNEEALNKLKQLGKQTTTLQPNYIAFVEAKKKKAIVTKAYAPKKKIEPVKPVVQQKPRLITYTYKQDNCHDFAWFASKHFIVQYDTVALKEKMVDVFSFYQPTQINNWNKSIAYAKDGLKKYSNWIGDYPYHTVSIVSGEENEFSGGMEYPTITLITTNAAGKYLDATIVHEIGHNWFYGALGNNERKYAWMDESINTYYQNRYEAEKYATEISTMPKWLQNKLPVDIESFIYTTVAGLKKSQPIDSCSTAFTSLNYYLSVYSKGSKWLAQIEKDLGRAKFDESMQNYFAQWKFKHPQPNDFKTSLEQSTQLNLNHRFKQLTSNAPLNDSVYAKKTKLVAFFNLKDAEKFNYISIAPIIGGNYYDKLSVGLVLHNYQIPVKKINFFIAPQYATGSKQLNYGTGITYNQFKQGSWLEISASALKYTMDDFKPANADRIYQNVLRINPSIKYTLYNKDLRSKQRWIFQARSFLMQENGLSFKTITTPGGPTDVVDKTTFNSTINQLKITSSNNRVLYPYELNLTIDQGKNYVRAGFTANYFLNYANKKGGINARLFAGKFIYTTDKTFIQQYETDRYHLNMSGAKGYEDYTYSGYFIGRNEFEGYRSQQIMERDGFFKVRTDLLSNKIGKTDDWLMALNFSGDIPESVNIFNVLPIKIPLKFFVDIGTYADAWKDNPATGRFLYDAGLQLPIANGLVNIYVPLLYSKVYSNYFKSTLGEKRFWKTLSFSIDIQKLQIHKLSRDLPL